MDDTARAIAQSRKVTRADRSDANPSLTATNSKPSTSRAARVGGRPLTHGPVPAPSTKRPKHPGG
jgi:hypothetical protein